MKYKRLICSGHNVIILEDYTLPDQLESSQVLVRNTFGAEKHGTMQSFIGKYGNQRGAWDAERQMHTPGEGMAWPYPIPLGNMQVGVVEKIGSGVSKYSVGNRLVFSRGFEPMSVINESEGWKLKENTSWKAAVCLDPAVYAFTAVRDSNLRIGDSVAIFSLGAIGLMAVTMAGLSGAYPIIAIDPVESRRKIALELGADIVLDPAAEENLGAKLRELTHWKGLDVIIEYSGTMQAMQAALRGIAFGANIVAGGFPGPWPAGLDLGAEAHMNRPNIIFSRADSDPGRDHPRWDKARVRDTVHRLILDGCINGEAVIGPVKTFGEDMPAVYEDVMSDPNCGAKMGLSYL